MENLVCIAVILSAVATLSALGVFIMFLVAVIKCVKENEECEKAIEETKRLKKRINDLTKFESPRWISVEDCLPEEYNDVLVCGKGIPGVVIDSVSYFNNKFLVYSEEVEYWMPIPKAPVDYIEEGDKFADV